MMDLADDYKGAATDALKKCATQLGMFLDVYGQREVLEEARPTQQQLDALYMRAEKLGWSKEQTDKWVEEQAGKKINECDRLEILGLIPKLIRLSKEQKK